jgi:uncharacterized protein involved in exopolysaccharide biosynthesis
MEDQNSIVEYSETDLADYIKVLFRQKWLILAVFLASIIAAVVATLMMPKIYRIETSIEVGQINGQPIEPLSQTTGKINNDVYSVAAEKDSGTSGNNYPKINAENLKDTNLIVLRAESDDVGGAKNALEKVDGIILKEHQSDVQKTKDLLTDNVNRINAKISSLEAENKNLKDKISSLQKTLLSQQTLAIQFILYDTKEELEKSKQEIEDLYLEASSLQKELDSISQTQIIKLVSVSGNQIKPNLVFNITIAGVLGLFVGIFFAFCKDWWEKNKSKITMRGV